MTLTIGSWPGKDSENRFILSFCDSVESSGLKLTTVEHPFRAIFRRMDVIQIHWPEKVMWGHGRLYSAFSALLATIGLFVLRCRGVKLVWCVHNLQPHEMTSVHFRLFWHLYISAIVWLVHGFITLSPSTLPLVRGSIPGLQTKPATFFWHPKYLINADFKASNEWKASNGLTGKETLFAFIGLIRPYKGIEELLDTFSKAPRADARLIIAGQPSTKEYKTLLETSAKADNRIILSLGLLSEEQFSAITLASDAIVLPFRKILHSGSVIYALSCGKPVITPSIPYVRDLQQQIGQNWIITYEGRLTENYFDRFVKPEQGKPDLDFLSSPTNGLRLAEFYKSLT